MTTVEPHRIIVIAFSRSPIPRRMSGPVPSVAHPKPLASALFVLAEIAFVAGHPFFERVTQDIDIEAKALQKMR